MLPDEDLADLYGVETKRLIQQVKRNAKRFPADFMFQLDQTEVEAAAATRHTSLQSREWRCFPASFAAIERLP